MADHFERARAWLENFQAELCRMLQAHEPDARFVHEEHPGRGGGVNRPAVLQGGAAIEKAAVHHSLTLGQALPAAATSRRPALAGASYRAASVSLIVHPRNPHAPTSHANFRWFEATPAGGEPTWWAGGGFDLTPYYGYDEDCVLWHRSAKQACERHDPALYPRFKRWCDEYFHLPHRDEARGIGGVFFDDFDAGGEAAVLALLGDLGEAFVSAYDTILRRRLPMAWGERERQWQLRRRGRYAEFNLAYDRGTRFGLQAGARAESLLASLPPLVAWEYGHEPGAGSPEAELLARFLPPRDWAAGG